MAQVRKRGDVHATRKSSGTRPRGGKRLGSGRWGSGPLQCTVCQHPDRGRIDYLIASGASMQSAAERFGLSKQRIAHHYKWHVSDRFKQMCAAQHLSSFEDALKNATEANIEAVDLCNLLIKGHAQRWAANLETGGDRAMNSHAAKILETLELRSRITLELQPETRSMTVNNYLVRDAAGLVAVLKDNAAAVAKVEEWYRARMGGKLIEHAEAAE
jgi:hypothetical protein